MSAATRKSAFNFLSSWDDVLPAPDGTIDQGDRQHLWGAYSGILVTGGVTVAQTTKTLARGLHTISALVKRRALQQGIPINEDIIGVGLEQPAAGTLAVKAKEGGFIIVEDDGISVDESILIPALTKETSLKKIQAEIDGAMSMFWSGMN